MLQAAQSVTWIKVEQPHLDIVRLVLGAFALAGVLLTIAFVLGIACGLLFIHRSRSRPRFCEDIELHLDSPSPS